MNSDFVPPAYQQWRMKRKDLQALATRLFSLYIRLKYADKYGYVRCFTCTRKRHYTEMHCGHYVSRKNMCTKFLEVNNHPQCPTCNVTYDGNLKKYRANLNKKYGTGTATYIEELGRKTCKFLRSDLMEVVDYAEKQLNDLL